MEDTTRIYLLWGFVLLTLFLAGALGFCSALGPLLGVEVCDTYVGFVKRTVESLARLRG